MICCLVLYMLLSKFASATIQATFPLNNQVPPVARISQSYTYQFASNTFTTTAGQEIIYSVHQAPAWLELDSASHSLRGTPGTTDVGSFTFALSATDGFGYADSQVTLLVVNDTAPSPTGNVSTVLAAAGALSGPTTLALGPGVSFTIHIGRDYFQSSDPIFLCATSEDRSPLPSWISFDAVTAIFTGTTPQPATGPRVYGIMLFASHVAGFAEVDIAFAINVANHKLLFTSICINTTISSLADVSIDIGAFLTLDGLPVPVESIADTSLRGPAWLRLDPTMLLLSGSPPEGTPSEEVIVSVSDIYGDDASMAVQLVFVLSMTNSAPASKTPVLTASATTSTSGLSTSNSGRPYQSSTVNSSSMDAGFAGMNSNHSGELSRGDIAAIIILPVLFVIGLLLVCFILALQGKRRRSEQSSEKEGNGLYRGADNHTNQEAQRRGFRNSWLPPISLGIGTEPNSSWHDLSQDTRGVSNETNDDTSSMFNRPPHLIEEGYNTLSDLVEAPPGTPSQQGRSRSGKSTLLSANWATTVSQSGPVLPGAGHGRAIAGFVSSGHMLSSNNRSSATRNSASMAADHSASYAGFGHDTMAHRAARKSAIRLQRLSTIRKISSTANDDPTRPAQRPFSELRQSFINRRASNPQRPLFSAGLAALRDSTLQDDRQPGYILSHIVSVDQQAEQIPTARFTRAEDIFQDGYPRAASQHSSNAWNDVDSASRYTLDESEEAPAEDETYQVAALRVRKLLPTHVPTVAGKAEAIVMGDESSNVAGNSAFV